MSSNIAHIDGPAHLQVGALRVVRSSIHYEATVDFYRDLVRLVVIDEFRNSYGEDGTIFGLPDASVHLEIVRSTADDASIDAFDQLVLYFPDRAAVDNATKRLVTHDVHPASEQHPYWRDNGGMTFHDPDGRAVIYAPWIYGLDPQPSDSPR